MSLTAPPWLTARDGRITRSPDGRSWLVELSGTPQYRLTPGPAGGKYTCAVHATVNGARLDIPTPQPTADDAAHAGLEALRAKLGW